MQAVFLDKDGTLIEEVPYNVEPGRIRLMTGAVAGLRSLHGAGYRLIVVSNQSGVARGFFPESALTGVEMRLHEWLAVAGAPLAGFYYCPHQPLGSVVGYATNCDCRKPAPGLLGRAAKEHGIALDRSWLIGDILDDIEAGRRAGCRTILLDNGHETEWVVNAERMPEYMGVDLVGASQIMTGNNEPALLPCERRA